MVHITRATIYIPYFSDHKAHLKSFNFLKNRKCASPYNAVRLMYGPGCASSSWTNLMW